MLFVSVLVFFVLCLVMFVGLVSYSCFFFFFFFFSRQKPASEFSAFLLGSEMCIRARACEGNADEVPEVVAGKGRGEGEGAVGPTERKPSPIHLWTRRRKKRG